MTKNNEGGVRVERPVGSEETALIHLREAMKLMRDSGADEREYVVYAVLASGDSDSQPEQACSTLYFLRARVDSAVAENFGYCPAGEQFSAMMDEMRAAEEKLRLLSPERWEAYLAKHY